mgnify:CR=1 FL=1
MIIVVKLASVLINVRLIVLVESAIVNVSETASVSPRLSAKRGQGIESKILSGNRVTRLRHMTC